ncbi:hypothetical protein [[Clostridium] innocuum]|uniref:hypothetical protein n=1 Tax=Clostridium innocuum TaxID=1522 RepID=UPI001F1C1B10|nr:hypothetical protein [[Clostridium] innocuum]
MPIVKQKQLYEKYDSAIQTALQPVCRLCMKGWILRADDLNDNRTGYQATDKKQMGPPVVAIQQDGQAEQNRQQNPQYGYRKPGRYENQKESGYQIGQDFGQRGTVLRTHSFMVGIAKRAHHQNLKDPQEQAHAYFS